jgi:hypothetical protein
MGDQVCRGGLRERKKERRKEKKRRRKKEGGQMGNSLSLTPRRSTEVQEPS